MGENRQMCVLKVAGRKKKFSLAMRDFDEMYVIGVKETKKMHFE